MYVTDLKQSITDRLVHTTNVLSENMEVTPEGFLLCKNVPIARMGWQDYLNDEIVGEDDPDNVLYPARSRDGVIRAERREADVFRPETLASFEGKDITDDHPDEAVGPHNYKEHTVGTVLNVRRGEDAMSDFIMADLLVKEANAIAAVRAGKREVSCGYDADYEVIGPGRVRQYNIIGNHTALVDRGRCGFRCAIGDEEPDMSSKIAKKPSLMRRVLDALANNDPRALKDAAEEMEKGEKEDKDAAPDAPALEATGTHIHLHLGGEQEASGQDPSVAGAADEEEEGGDPAAADPAASNDDMHKRMMKLEAGLADVLQALRAIAKKVGMEGSGEDSAEEEEEAAEGDSDGEEEAEGEVPGKDEAEVEEEPKEKKDKAKDKTKDAAVKDSKALAPAFKDALSGAEILSPGIKLPVFDSKVAAKVTMDSICLLKRRALAAATRDDKNGGAESVKLMLGDRALAGMACDQVGIAFNGAVALMRDRNTRDDRNAGRARPANDKTAPPVINSAADFNSAMRTLHKQAAPK